MHAHSFFATFPSLNALSPIRGLVGNHFFKISPPKKPPPPRQLHVRDFAFSCPPPDCRRATDTGEKFAYLTSAKQLLASGYIVFTHVNIINENSQKVHVVHNGQLAVFHPTFCVNRCRLDPSRTLKFLWLCSPERIAPYGATPVSAASSSNLHSPPALKLAIKRASIGISVYKPALCKALKLALHAFMRLIQ